MSISPGTRDIDVVLVTGAGASCAFGVNQTRLPLMGDWSEHLVKALGRRDPAYLRATGLASGMSGEQFEQQLGRFLRRVEAFNQIEALLEPISSFAPSVGTLVPADQWTAWHTNALSQLAQVTGIIHETLYELFAASAVDLGGAQRAYGSLLAQLAVGPSTRLVYATTNYDTIGEHVLLAHAGLPDAGEVHTPEPQAERQLRVDRLLDGIPRYVPVLHLHGRVGWLRRRDGAAYSTPLRQYDSSSGVPIVMLPDPDKDYDTDPIIATIWQQFEEALARARIVLVLGHSLHDHTLVAALRTHVEPPSRLAVTVLPTESLDVREMTDGDEVRARVTEILPGAEVLSCRFEQDLGEVPRLQDWRLSA